MSAPPLSRESSEARCSPARISAAWPLLATEQAGCSTATPTQHSTTDVSFARRADDVAVVVPANAGDHPLIHRLLLEVHQGPSREEFHATHDDPFYEPTDRLLIKRGDRIVSHVLLTKRVMHFGHANLPVAEFQWLATLPEYQSAGYTEWLLRAAEQQMLEDGAVVALMQTQAPQRFEAAGWFVCGRPSYVRVGPRELLAHLSDEIVAPGRRRRRISTRLWRHVEIRSLMKLYQQNTQHSHGPLQRSEAYWQWLVSRKAYEQILVAIEGDDRLDFGEQASTMVGYAVTKGERIVELMVDRGHPAVVAELLRRASREAIERDVHTMHVHAMPDDPLYELILAAGGEPCAPAGEVFLLKIVGPGELARRLYPEFHSRAKAAGLSRPCALHFQVDERRCRFVLTRRSARFDAGEAAAVDVTCSGPQLARLLLGQLDAAGAVASGELKVRGKTILDTLNILFPQRSLLRPSLDNLQV